MDQMPMSPPPAELKVQQAYKQKKDNLERAFKQFHELLFKKVLDENKSPGEKKTEMHMVKELLDAAQALDHANTGDGVFALASIAIREHLKIRDRINELEFKLYLALRDIRELQDKAGIKHGGDKPTKQRR